MTLDDLLQQVKDSDSAKTLEFADVIAVIDANYYYTPSTFFNGELENSAGSNEGSCKIFAFAQLQQLTPAQTLSLFGRYYRDDVLGQPEACDHANIRTFMSKAWAGIRFAQMPLEKIMNPLASDCCPLCKADNHCGQLQGSATACWCMQQAVPQALLDQVPEQYRGTHCVCQACVEAFKAQQS